MLIAKEGAAIVNLNSVSKFFPEGETKITFIFSKQHGINLSFSNKQKRDEAMTKILSAYDNYCRIVSL